MNKAVDSVIKIPCDLDKNFFRYWLEFLKPFHNLTERETEVAAAFLKHRYELSKSIIDENILDKVVMSEESKRQIRESCNMTLTHFQVILTKLKKNRLFVDGRINPRYIPQLKVENGNFKMLLLFDFNV